MRTVSTDPRTTMTPLVTMLMQLIEKLDLQSMQNHTTVMQTLAMHERVTARRDDSLRAHVNWTTDTAQCALVVNFRWRTIACLHLVVTTLNGEIYECVLLPTSQGMFCAKRTPARGTSERLTLEPLLEIPEIMMWAMPTEVRDSTLLALSQHSMWGK